MKEGLDMSVSEEWQNWFNELWFTNSSHNKCTNSLVMSELG